MAYAYRESRILERWHQEVEPVLVSICKEQSPLFERYGYFLEMRRWRIVFRSVVSDSESMYIPHKKEPDMDIPRVVSVPSSEHVETREEAVSLNAGVVVDVV